MKQIIGHPLVLLALGAILFAYAAFFNRADNRVEQEAAIARGRGSPG
jgi:hypothetical protein